MVTWIELAKHNKKSDCWIAIEGKVFDVSSYFAEHPGGDDVLMNHAGRDATKGF